MSEIVPKPWGYEYCAFDNGNAAVWILHIARGRQTSRHCHPNKRTQLVLLQGEARFNGAPMKPLETRDIGKGEYHQTSVVAECLPASENGAFVMEIEEPSNKADIVREDDAYGRAGTPIESHTVPTRGPLLELTRKGMSLMGYTFRLETSLGGGSPVPDLALDVGGEMLMIYREPTRKVSDCVADFVADLGVRHVFAVCGGGAMHLDDSFGHHEALAYVAMHHEQAAAMAAESYARASRLGCCLVTTGPGGTNAITGCSCAWVDSIPVLFLSGQVTRDTLMAGRGLRQFGVQETDIVTIVQSITKYAVTVTDERDIRYELEKASHIALSGRPGPVWVDIPLDIQSKQVNWSELRSFDTGPRSAATFDDLKGISGERPVLVIGNGVHLAHAEGDCRRLVEHLGMPVVSSWTAADIVPTDHPLYIGRFGIFGDRAANFAVQNAGLLIVLGSRLSVPQTGHNFKTFARDAKIVMVDADWCEMSKPSFHVEHKIVSDVGDFIRWALEQTPAYRNDGWIERCQAWKRRYPVVASESRNGNGVNSFTFIDALCDELPADAVVVTDMGTAFTCTFQAARMKLGQRWITASGHAPMGYGLPGAIGAHYATGKPVVCIVGDGALMFNLQELQTIAHHNLPITVFVLENGGYLTMKHTFANHFGRQTGSDGPSGVSFPSTIALANTFGFGWGILDRDLKTEHVATMLERCSDEARPILCSVRMDPMQPLIPRSSSMKRPDGSIASRPIEDMYPFLPREELKANMIVEPAEVFE